MEEAGRCRGCGVVVLSVAELTLVSMAEKETRAYCLADSAAGFPGFSTALKELRGPRLAH